MTFKLIRYFQICFILSLVSPYSVVGQKDTSRSSWKIGEPCPKFSLSDIHYYKSSVATNETFLGTWLVLDFWNRYCGACIASFPKTNKLQKEFRAKAQFMLIGYTGSQYTNTPDAEKIKVMYERIRAVDSLGLSIAYDSTLFERLGIAGCPYLVIIDPEGIIRYITTKIEADQFSDIISGKTIKLARSFGEDEDDSNYRGFNFYKPFLLFGNGGSDTDFVYRSLISNWHEGMPVGRPSFTSTSIPNGVFQIMGVKLESLYNLAYLGRLSLDIFDPSSRKFSYNPILQLRDSSDFSAKRKYCYSLIFKSGAQNLSFGRMRRILTNELSNYFEYKVSIIAVKSPCWKLIAYPGARSLLKQNNLISNDSEAIEHVQFKCFQQPISVLINALYADNQTQIFIDKTRIKGNVSLQLDCFMGNINEANKALKKYGLSLIKGSIKARGLRIVKR